MIKELGFLFAFLFAISTMSLNAQFESIKGLEVDLIQSHTEGDLQGYNTYRVYAVMENEGDAIMAVYGQEKSPLLITTDGEFYQHPRGGATSREVHRYDLTELSKIHPLLEYDSWLTIGYEDHYENAVSSLAMDVRDFEDTQNVADSIYTNDGAWFVYPDVNAPTKQAPKQCVAGPSKRILLMQLTTNGNLEGLINVQGMTRIFDLYMEEDGTYQKTRNNIRNTGLQFMAKKTH